MSRFTDPIGDRVQEARSRSLQRSKLEGSFAQGFASRTPVKSPSAECDPGRSRVFNDHCRPGSESPGVRTWR